MSFGNNLKVLMADRHITQTELAKKIDYTQRAVSKWINGQSEPTENAIIKCAKFFDVSLDYLLGENEYYEEKQPSINHLINFKFGSEIKEFRLAYHLTPQHLAKKIGISENDLMQIEDNIVEPSATLLRKLSAFFKVPAGCLLGLESPGGLFLYQELPQELKELFCDPINYQSNHTPEETHLLEIYRNLSPDMKATLWSLLDTWSPSTAQSKNKV